MIKIKIQINDNFKQIDDIQFYFQEIKVSFERKLKI